MPSAARTRLVSVQDYLAGELVAPTRHEYLGGILYAMAGARNAHNLIATNALVALGGRLRGKPCRPYNSDTKIRIRLPFQLRFYYPDLSIVCRPNPQTDSFQDEPALVLEVVPEETRRTDEGEKKDAYAMIPSLSVYLMAEQDEPLVVAYRRGEHGFVREVHAGLTAVVPLPEIGAELPLTEIYDGIRFTS
jgi:Uma2 family endonuclease